MAMGQPIRGVVAAGHPLTAEAGAAMLRQGGNAFDAAIAAALTACVCESALTSLGGGGFLLAHTAEGTNRLFDFFSQTPNSRASKEPLHFYPVEVNFGDATQKFHIGLGAMAVPGMLAGLSQVHRQLGRLPLEAIAEPAMHWACIGSDVDPFRDYVLQILRPILTATEAAREIYAPTGTLLRLGDRLRMPAFADILKRLVQQEGLNQFYRGEIAHQIVRDCEDIGGYFSLDDFLAYQGV
ncbi:gamma-glutamyltransferase, partial [filamentous cyanobacterium CCP5]